MFQGSSIPRRRLAAQESNRHLSLVADAGGTDLPARAQDAELVQVVKTPEDMDKELAEALGVARELARRSIAKNTEDSYRSNLRSWDRWCVERGVMPMPPDPIYVVAHLVELTCEYADGSLLCDDEGRPVAGRVRPVTASQRLAALNRMCDANDLARPGDDRRVQDVMSAIRRTFGIRPAQAKAALDLTLLRALLAKNAEPTEAQLRDRAVALTSAHTRAGAGQLARLRWEAVTIADRLVILDVPVPTRAKERITVTFHATGRSTCPVAALAAWHERCGRPAEGPVFALSRQGMVNLLARLEKRAGGSLMPANVGPVIRSNMAPTARQVRNHALLLTSWMAALRRSSTSALDWQDLEDLGEDVKVILERSKTDQEGNGLHNWLPRLADSTICPVAALRAWKDVVTASLGAPPSGRMPVFVPIDRHGNLVRTSNGHPKRLSGDAIAEVVQELAARAELDPESFAAHSLRAGWITEAANQGRSALEIQLVSHHRSAEMVMRYFRPADSRRNNPTRSMLEGAVVPSTNAPAIAASPPPASLTERLRSYRRPVDSC